MNYKSKIHIKKSNEEKKLKILVFTPPQLSQAIVKGEGGGGWIRFNNLLKVSSKEEIEYNVLEYKPIKKFQFFNVSFMIISMIFTLIRTIIMAKLRNIQLILCPIEEPWAIILSYLSSKIIRRKYIIFINSIPFFGLADVPISNGDFSNRTSYTYLIKIIKTMTKSKIKPIFSAIMWCSVFRILRLPSSHIICLSQCIVNELHKYKIEPAVDVFPGNGIDYNLISSINVKTKKYDAIYASGSLLPQKGIFEVIKLWENIVKEKPNAKLAIAGRISSDHVAIIEKLNYLITNLGLNQNVTIICDPLKGMTQRELWEEMKHARIFLYPSRKDVWPLVIGEALACSLPVIAYDLPDIRYAYGDCQAVYLLSIGNLQESAKTAIRLLDDNSLYEELSYNAQKYAKNHDWIKIIQIEKKAYLTILNN